MPLLFLNLHPPPPFCLWPWLQYYSANLFHGKTNTQHHLFGFEHSAKVLLKALSWRHENIRYLQLNCVFILIVSCIVHLWRRHLIRIYAAGLITLMLGSPALTFCVTAMLLGYHNKNICLSWTLKMNNLPSQESAVAVFLCRSTLFLCACVSVLMPQFLASIRGGLSCRFDPQLA